MFFAQAHFLESTNQNTNVDTQITKDKTDESFRVAVKRLSRGCQDVVTKAVITVHYSNYGLQ